MYSISDLLEVFVLCDGLTVDDKVEMLLREMRKNRFSFAALVESMYEEFRERMVMEDSPYIQAVTAAQILIALWMREDQSIATERQHQLQDNMLNWLKKCSYQYRGWDGENKPSRLRIFSILGELAKVAASRHMFALEILTLLQHYNYDDLRLYKDVYVELAKRNDELHEYIINCLFEKVLRKGSIDYRKSLLIELVSKRYLNPDSVYTYCFNHMSNEYSRIAAINTLSALVHVAPHYADSVLGLFKTISLDPVMGKEIERNTLSVAQVKGLNRKAAIELLHQLRERLPKPGLSPPVEELILNALGHLAVNVPSLSQDVFAILEQYPIDDPWMDVAKANPDLRERVLKAVLAGGLCISAMKCAELACAAPEWARTMFDGLQDIWNNLDIVDFRPNNSWPILEKFIESEAVRTDAKLQEDVFRLTDVIHHPTITIDAKRALTHFLEKWMTIVPNEYDRIYRLVVELLADADVNVRITAGMLLEKLAMQATGKRGVEMVKHITTLFATRLPEELCKMLAAALQNVAIQNSGQAECDKVIGSALVEIYRLFGGDYNELLWPAHVAWFFRFEGGDDTFIPALSLRDSRFNILFSQLHGCLGGMMTNEKMIWLETQVQTMREAEDVTDKRAILLDLIANDLNERRSERVVATNYLRSRLPIDCAQSVTDFFYRKPAMVDQQQNEAAIATPAP